jgi:molybdopterin synthase catalytic subunit
MIGSGPDGHVEITESPIDLNQLVAHVQHDGIGAVATFLGTVRDLNDGRRVTGIDYEAYQPMAEVQLREIVDEVQTHWDGLRIAIVHRVGTLRVGEISVAIACAHARRAPAADAMRTAIEALKVRVPIWKREHYADGEWTWVDPTRSTVQAAPK